LPDIDKELEAIKKLIGDTPALDQPEAPPEIVFGLNELVPPAEQEIEPMKAPVHEQRSGLPALRDQPVAPAVSKRPAPPAIKNQPAPPAINKRPATPAMNKRPEPPALNRQTASTSIDKKPSPPSMNRQPVPHLLNKQPAPPDDPGSRKGIRSYEISPDGEVTEKTGGEKGRDTGSADFKVKFDFDEAYKDVPENRPLRLRRERRTGCIGGVLYAAFVICISITLAAVMWMAAVDILGFGADNEQVNITVKQGFSIEDITEMLYDAGLIQYRFLFDFYAGFSNAQDKITPGAYVLNKNFDYRALVQGMTARAGVRVETTVAIPEGFTLAQIFTLLEDYGVCPAPDLWEAATNHEFDYHFLDEDTLGDRLRLEGFLFPETYNFYLDSTAVQAIGKFLYEFNRRFTETYIERAEEMGYTVQEIINIAAMIEREAGSDEERPRIAAVIYNRLNSKDFPHIQIDATIRYAIMGTGIPFSVDYDHPYNTYVYEGLPPGPIANPGINSIEAALYPDTTNEYYYALNKSGTHEFFRTSAQHQAFVNSSDYGGR